MHVRAWDQGDRSDDITSSCIESFFGSAPGGAILSSDPYDGSAVARGGGPHLVRDRCNEYGRDIRQFPWVTTNFADFDLTKNVDAVWVGQIQPFRKSKRDVTIPERHFRGSVGRK
jgi:hypothetical protein